MQWLDSTLDLFCYCTHMPFRTGPLDAVTCSEVLEHIPDIKKATAEIARVLKPAGGTSCSRCLSSIPLHGEYPSGEPIPIFSSVNPPPYTQYR